MENDKSNFQVKFKNVSESIPTYIQGKSKSHEKIQTFIENQK